MLLLIVIAIISQIRLTVLGASIWAFLLRHNKSKYSGKILYQEEQWHKRPFLWNIEEHPTWSGPFPERMNIEHTIYFGYLTQDGQEHQKRLMDFLFKPAEKTHALESILYILLNDCTQQSGECVRQIIICHDYARLSMWEISPIIQWIDINITIKSDWRLETSSALVTTAALAPMWTLKTQSHNRPGRRGDNALMFICT